MNEITPPPFPAAEAPPAQEYDIDLPPPVLPEQILQSLEDGRMRDLLALDGRDFKIRPLARRLAQVNRYGGASPHPYAVTTHSLLVSRLIDMAAHDAHYGGLLFHDDRFVLGAPAADLSYHALMHDVTEAFGIVDMIRPVKLAMPAYQALEHAIRAQLVGPFGIPPEDSRAIKRADERAYQLECKYHRGKWPGVGHTAFDPWPVTGLEHEAALFYVKQEINWRDSASLFVQAFERLAPNDVKARCL